MRRCPDRGSCWSDLLARSTSNDRGQQRRGYGTDFEPARRHGKRSRPCRRQLLHSLRALTGWRANRFRTRSVQSSELILRELSGFEVRALPVTKTATTPFFSPDGRWVGFWRAEDRHLRRVSIDGGSPIDIGPTDVPQSALWGSNDEILFETGFPNGELWSIPASGGTPQHIPASDRANGERISLRARVPGGNDLLVASIRPGESWLEVLSRKDGTRRRLLKGGSNVIARYTRTGHLVYSDSDALFAVMLNQRFEPVGAPAVVMHGIDHLFWHSNVALSENGTVAYLPAERVREAEFVWLDRQGNVTPVPGGRNFFNSVALSPDGREVATEAVEGTKTQVWIFDLERETRRACSPPKEITGARSGAVTAHSLPTYRTAKTVRLCIEGVRMGRAVRSYWCAALAHIRRRVTGPPTTARSCSASTPIAARRTRIGILFSR